MVYNNIIKKKFLVKSKKGSYWGYVSIGKIELSSLSGILETTKRKTRERLRS